MQKDGVAAKWWHWGRGKRGGSAQLSGRGAIWSPLSSQAIRFLMGPSLWFPQVQRKNSQALLAPCLAPWPQPHKNPAQENETSSRKLGVFVVKPATLRKMFCSAEDRRQGQIVPKRRREDQKLVKVTFTLCERSGCWGPLLTFLRYS